MEAVTQQKKKSEAGGDDDGVVTEDPDITPSQAAKTPLPPLPIDDKGDDDASASSSEGLADKSAPVAAAAVVAPSSSSAPSASPIMKSRVGSPPLFPSNVTKRRTRSTAVVEEPTHLILARMRKDAKTVGSRALRRCAALSPARVDTRDLIIVAFLVVVVVAYVGKPWILPLLLTPVHYTAPTTDRPFKGAVSYVEGNNEDDDDDNDQEILDDFDRESTPMGTGSIDSIRKQLEQNRAPPLARHINAPPPPPPVARASDHESVMDVEHLRFFFEAREIEHIRPTAEALAILSPSKLDDFIKGYVRGRYACEDVAHYLGWIGLIEASSSDTRSKFNNRLYLSSSSIYSPYFCINFPLEQFMQADGEIRRLHDVRRLAKGGGNSNSNNKKIKKPAVVPLIDDWILNQLVDTIFISWKVLTESRDGAQYTVSPTDSFAQSPIHNMNVMGYERNGFFARNLSVLGADKTPAAEVIFVFYDAFVETARQLFSEAAAFSKSQSHKLVPPICLCGPHVALGRHLVAYSDGRQRQVIYIEPIVVKSSGVIGPEPAISPTGRGVHQSEKRSFAWTANAHAPGGAKASSSSSSSSKNDLFAQYIMADTMLRERFGIANGVNMATSITVDYVTITSQTPGTSTTPAHNFYNDNGARTIAHLDGQESLCIQYCEHMAYALMSQMEHADTMKNVKLKTAP